MLMLFLTVGAATASAQTTCTVTNVTQTLRGGGLTELVGYIVLTCAGGTPTALGSPVPVTSITLQIVGGAIGVTNRLLATDPLNGTLPTLWPSSIRRPIARNWFASSRARFSGPATDKCMTGRPATRTFSKLTLPVQSRVIVWYGVPIDGGSHTIRLTNVRVAANQYTFEHRAGSCFRAVSTTPTNILASSTGALRWVWFSTRWELSLRALCRHSKAVLDRTQQWWEIRPHQEHPN